MQPGFYRYGYTPPANCGQKYAHLVQAGGYGPDNATGYKPWAGDVDLKAWLGTAKVIFGMVRLRWNALMDIENARGDWTNSRAVRPYITAYEKTYAALPQPKWYPQPAGLDGELEQVVRNAEAGACAIEVLDDAIAAAGGDGQPMPWGPAPAPPADLFGFGTNVLVIVGVLAGVYLLSQQGGRR